MSGLKKTKRGRGMLREEVISWSADEDLTPEESEIVQQRYALDTLDGRCDAIEQWIGEHLAAADLPVGQGPWEFDSRGAWWRRGDPRPQNCVPPIMFTGGSPTSIAIAKGLDPDAPAMLAIRMSETLLFARQSLDDGKVERFGMQMFYLGMKWARMGLSDEHGQTFEKGEKQITTLETARAHAATARREARMPEWEAWAAEANAIWQRNPTLKKTDVARRVKAKLELNETIKAITNRIGNGPIERSKT